MSRDNDAREEIMAEGGMAEGGKMSDNDMDRILSKHDEILPSSGFAASVMEAVRREASAPPPIPFPWRRALPGIVVATFALVLVVVVGIAAILQMSRGVLSLRAPAIVVVAALARRAGDDWFYRWLDGSGSGRRHSSRLSFPCVWLLIKREASPNSSEFAT